MAGIYLHIPFCKTRCIYCDFYSSTQSNLIKDYISALCRELEMRKEYLQDESIETIYFGGGTPSLLSEKDFHQIFDIIEHTYGLSACKEITLEANPDDLSPEYLETLSHLPFNRISIGIQTFNNATLRLLKRRHNAEQAIRAVEHCRQAGFNNISIDLIYGLPGETEETWQKDLEQAISLNVEHISAYHLTYEKGTPIYNMLQKKQIKEVDEESSIRFFTLLVNNLTAAGYEHYEISNFCLPEKYSRHNTSYWKGIKYLGCGPSAHSFDGETREWNVSSITSYIKGINTNERSYKTEHLDTNTRYNELIITSIRTRWGLSLEQVSLTFGQNYLDYCLSMARKFIENGQLEILNEHLKLTEEGIFISDGIMSELLKVED
ncbi:radical SAM family heme chaperone HemW [uncultured Bacteroides sp.]|uniref:radical SAM family heme chaperone HemW n=1 Tax=uncultured Bacteroides sp. TaxID=162156 RepID=UPI002AA92DF4|nr:radical SAM family heme chaperone HemW [uncultured Bacteroides sp.]